MHQETYGFSATDIHGLAADLARELEIVLYLQQSPQIGPWYSSEDLSAITGAIREGMQPVEPERSFWLTLNNPEPGYRGPTIPDGGHCLLTVWAPEDVLDDIEDTLRRSGLPFRCHGRRQS
jgi:hypothetical protein